MIGLTLCSGIGAPEVAAPWIDWRFASEIEEFPRAVLQHRFGYRAPEDHNQGDPLLWGDMREVTPDLLRSRGIPLPDIIVAGTPCQAFSVAGARKGLADARGNLTLAFVEILHAIVAARPGGRLAVLWENVPGVLSDKGNAFGCFLGGIVGAMDALPCPAGRSWPGEGMVEGPRARAAWAVLDAQWFGVAQRRQRVFVVVDFGGALDPAAVLLEPDRLRGNSPPRRGQGAPVAALTSNGVGTCGADDNQGQAGHLIEAFGGGRTSGPIEAAACLTAKGQRIDFEVETFIAHALRGEGFDASEDGNGRGTPLVPVAFQDRFRGDDGRGYDRAPPVFEDMTGTLETVKPWNVAQPVAGPLTAGMGKSAARMPQEQGALIPVAFDTTQITSKANYSNPKPGDPCHPLAAGAHPPAVAFAIQERATSTNPKNGPDGKGYREDDAAYTLEARSVPQAVATPWAVRRLMPMECERLQGFPDDHTRIPDWSGWRKVEEGEDIAELEAAGLSIKRTKKFTWVNDPDGPRYKAIGNSMAVPVIKWIMDRMAVSMAEAAQ